MLRVARGRDAAHPAFDVTGCGHLETDSAGQLFLSPVSLDRGTAEQVPTPIYASRPPSVADSGTPDSIRLSQLSAWTTLILNFGFYISGAPARSQQLVFASRHTCLSVYHLKPCLREG